MSACSMRLPTRLALVPNRGTAGTAGAALDRVQAVAVALVLHLVSSLQPVRSQSHSETLNFDTEKAIQMFQRAAEKDEDLRNANRRGNAPGLKPGRYKTLFVEVSGAQFG